MLDGSAKELSKWLGGSAAALAATAVGLLFSVNAPADPPSLTLEATDAVIGETIRATAELAESPGADGAITFEVFGADDPTCVGPALDQSSADVTGEGQYASEDFEPSTAGPYYWSARYPGDGVNEPAEANCSATSIVSKASPEMTGTATSGTIGGTVHDEVTLAGGFSPGGEVTFSVYGPGDADCETPLETSTATVTGDEAIADDFTPQQAGEFRWSANYEGDADNEPFLLDCEADGQTSTVARATAGLAGTATSTLVGGTITDQATLSGGFQPGGQIVFKAYGPDDASCATAPAYEATVAVAGTGPYSPAGFAPGPGIYRWTAEYEGDGNNQAAVLGCDSGGQSSTVSKATPGLAGSASSGPVGTAIRDEVTVSGGLSPGGGVTFRVYAPGDATCATPLETTTAPISGGKATSGDFQAQQAGAYRWTAEYEGDGNNQAVALGCNAVGQSSAVGTVDVTLSAEAGGGVVGNPVSATATVAEGANPGGQIVFRAFPPGDASCSGAAAFTSTVGVAGNGSYRSAAFAPGRVGTFRWTVAYTGDANHAAASLGCGRATSSIAQAKPSIAGTVPQRIPVGNAFSDTAILQGGFAPNGTITFRIYGPVAAGCAGPAFVNSVALTGNGAVSSDPFVAQRPGRYSFSASYSGDAENQAASEPCDSPSQVVQVVKRSPKVKPRAILVGGKQISIRAHLSRSFAPAGAITFRLYGPGDTSCRRKPKFSGGVKVKSNGTISLARYLATGPGTYRLSVAYSGDKRNRRFSAGCGAAQQIRVK